MLLWASQLRNLAGGLTSEMFSIGPLKATREYLGDLHAHTHTRTQSHTTAELMNICLKSCLETCNGSASVLQDASNCRSSSAFHLLWWKSSRRQGMTKLQTKPPRCCGWVYGFSVGKFCNKRRCNCQQEENLCEIGVEIPWRGQLCHISDWRDDF